MLFTTSDDSLVSVCPCAVAIAGSGNTVAVVEAILQVLLRYGKCTPTTLHALSSADDYSISSSNSNSNSNSNPSSSGSMMQEGVRGACLCLF